MTEFDMNGDSHVDMVTFDYDGQGNEEVTAFDRDQNGVYESLCYDSDGDGDFEVWFSDQNQDSRYERADIDQDNDLAPDIALTDTDQDGVLDRATEIDAGTTPADLRELETAYVGPVTNPDGTYGLLLELAEHSGTAAWPAPDADYDAYPDHLDRYPYDPTRA